jgi:histidine triad (HIT) family protein
LSLSCLFCQIVRGERTASIVLDEPEALAFLDHRPLFPGHCLVVPRAHHVTLPDVPPAEVGPFFQQVQRVSRAVESGLGAEGVFVAINNKISQSVPHLHVHVVPRRAKDGLKGFFWPRTPYRDADHEREVAEQLRAAIAAG